MKWKSFAQWRKGAEAGNKNQITDEIHNTKKQAQDMCSILRDYGLGLQSRNPKQRPVRIWIAPDDKNWQAPTGHIEHSKKRRNKGLNQTVRLLCTYKKPCGCGIFTTNAADDILLFQPCGIHKLERIKKGVFKKDVIVRGPLAKEFYEKQELVRKLWGVEKERDRLREIVKEQYEQKHHQKAGAQ
jgi:hypothetical protein